MKESGFQRAINSKLHRSIYYHKNDIETRRGVADYYYSGIAGDCWIEYKYLKPAPTRHFTPTRFLSIPQQGWLEDRQAEGRTVAVIYGSQAGIIIQESDFLSSTPVPATWIRFDRRNGGLYRTAIDYIERQTTLPENYTWK